MPGRDYRGTYGDDVVARGYFLSSRTLAHESGSTDTMPACCLQHNTHNLACNMIFG